MQCSKTFILTVNAPLTCPNWAVFPWGVPVLTLNGDGVASFSPDSASSNTFVTNAATFGTVGFNYAKAAGGGSIVYSGPACNCQVDLVLTKTFGPLDIGGLLSIGDQDNAYLFTDFFLTASGVYNLPFTVADGTVIPRTITVQVEAYVNNIGPASIDVTGSITKV